MESGSRLSLGLGCFLASVLTGHTEQDPPAAVRPVCIERVAAVEEAQSESGCSPLSVCRPEGACPCWTRWWSWSRAAAASPCT